MVIALRGEHSHDSDLLKAMVEEKCQDVIKNAVENVNVAPRTALKDLTNVIMSDNQMGSSGLLHLPKPRSIAKTIQRKRKTDNNILDLPHQWEDMYVSDMFKHTSDDEIFLILEEHISNNTKKVYYCIVMYCFVLYFIVSYCIILYRIVLYCIVL